MKKQIEIRLLHPASTLKSRIQVLQKNSQSNLTFQLAESCVLHYYCHPLLV
ncbi:MAG: hypothetical protein P8X74_04260 [Reinekea sp.]